MQTLLTNLQIFTIKIMEIRLRLCTGVSKQSTSMTPSVKVTLKLLTFTLKFTNKILLIFQMLKSTYSLLKSTSQLDFYLTQLIGLAYSYKAHYISFKNNLLKQLNSSRSTLNKQYLRSAKKKFTVSSELLTRNSSYINSQNPALPWELVSSLIYRIPLNILAVCKRWIATMNQGKSLCW